MRIRPLLIPLIPLGGLLGAASFGRPTPSQPDRSPTDLALSSDGRWAITANSSSGTASLVDLRAGAATAEVATGKSPFGVALSRDGRRAVISNWLSNTVTLLGVAPPGLRPAGEIAVGNEPRGVAISPDGARAFVALAGDNEVAVLNLAAGKVDARIKVGEEPWHLALTRDGSRLAVGCARSMEILVIDTARLTVHHTVKLRGRNVRHVAISPDGEWALAPHISERGRPVTRENIDQGWVIGSRLSRTPLREEGPREAIALDPRGKAVGDVDGLAVSPDGETLALTAAGTHELLLLKQELPFVAYGGPGDHIEPELLRDARRFRRIPLAGRPLGVAFTPGGRSVVVANYLSNAVQVIDTGTGEIARIIPLGGPDQPSAARRGEAIFYDAERCFNQWYSCGSCHVEGHTNGSTFDTFNDGSYDTPKKTLSLRGVSRTPPYTWHGWNPDLRRLVHDSMVRSMQGPEPSDSDLDAVVAFLKTLDFRPPAPPRDAAAARRGEAVFRSRDCASCHAPPDYTSAGIYTVGLESPGDVFRGFNPPPLREVGGRAPYLHDGRARNLDEVLTRYHRPSQLNGKPDLTPEEAADLAAFLRSI